MSLFSDLKPTAHLSRNVFDRSRSETFSTKLGMLTPCFVEHTIPKGKYKINCSDIVRVSEQQTANFVGLSQNIEFCFVPYSQLWHGFNRMYYGKGELTRNISYGTISPDNPPVPNNVPTFSIKSVFERLFKACFKADWWLRESAVIRSGSITSEQYSFVKNWLVSSELSYNVSSTDWFELPFHDVHWRFCGFDQLRVLDMLGYGNFLPIMKPYLGVQATIPTGSINSSFGQQIDSVCDEIWNQVIAPSMPNNQCNPFALMAYCKFFSDIYRNREYDDRPYYRLFNADWFSGNVQVDGISTDVILRLCKPFYRMYKKDLFTGVFPNAQFGGVSTAPLSNPSFIKSSNATGSDSYSSDIRVYNYNGNLTNVVNGSSFTSWNIDSNVSALAVRQAEALQRLKEKLVRAGNREKDLQKAIFGVGSKYIEDSYVDFLGSYQTPIQMNPVAATTAASELSTGLSSQQNVGDLGAYSVGSLEMGSQKEIEFEAYDFGVIIGVCYLLPETKYESFGFDPHNIKMVATDYYMPQMQNLGLAPVYSNIINMFGKRASAPSVSTLGYLSRYWEYKTAISRVHGEFFGSNPAVSFDDKFGDVDMNVLPSDTFGAFSDYVAPRNIHEVSQGTLQMLYVNPADADRIFYLSESPLPSFDHFKFEMSFRVKAVLPMSVTGLPD